MTVCDFLGHLMKLASQQLKRLCRVGQADRMLDMGFEPQIRRIVEVQPSWMSCLSWTDDQPSCFVHPTSFRRSKAFGARTAQQEGRLCFSVQPGQRRPREDTVTCEANWSRERDTRIPDSVYIRVHKNFLSWFDTAQCRQPGVLMLDLLPVHALLGLQRVCRRFGTTSPWFLAPLLTFLPHKAIRQTVKTTLAGYATR